MIRRVDEEAEWEEEWRSPRLGSPRVESPVSDRPTAQWPHVPGRSREEELEGAHSSRVECGSSAPPSVGPSVTPSTAEQTEERHEPPDKVTKVHVQDNEECAIM